MSTKTEVVYILGTNKRNSTRMEMSNHPALHTEYASAINEAKRLLVDRPDVAKVFVFKCIVSVKELDPVFEITEFENNTNKQEVSETFEKPLVDQTDFIKPIKSNDPCVLNIRGLRSTGPMVQLFTLDIKSLFWHAKTLYRLLYISTSEASSARVFNLDTRQEEDMRFYVYVLPVEEQTP